MNNSALNIHPPSWLNAGEYPFTSRTFSHTDGRIHYIDEGSGPVILFVHGTPDWSFGFRHLINALSKSHRCIAIDHLGFGLSDKPLHAELTVAAHARRLQDLIDHLKLKDLTLVVTDFGGGIGLEHALRHPGNVRRILLYNTWMWPLNDDKRFARPARMMRGWLGRWLYLHMGFSVRVMMPSAYGDRSKLTPAIHAHFKKVFPDAPSRRATFALVKEMLDAGPFWKKQWSEMGRVSDIPVDILWGMKDKFFRPDLMDRWKDALPQAWVTKVEHAGHFVHEEAPEVLVEVIRGSQAKTHPHPRPLSQGEG
jgi:pimeloyl-ACP methyl ester carboxylesterase